MPNFGTITVATVGQIGFWQTSMDGIKDTYPLVCRDAPPREPTFLPPPLPVLEQMEELRRYRWAVDESVRYLRDHATNGEEQMVVNVLTRLKEITEAENRRIQHAIWTIDPARYQWELQLRQVAAEIVPANANRPGTGRAQGGANQGAGNGGN
ncbi:uncharacterized protein BKA55DRAFT_546079 [Fusarium redolens]|uniref:Uncharacterized protein n=1 Tax=Fusarium redolens TaxID=48865 RepID=A0A9P9FX29_FUSRE|nr:uncharacterized protein BKA55DRAFT_546079 [Fusarium redolens]KAH7222565.1 hypothetical protein BKA55DRAFT_546079 [Fusarium redolens]